MDDPDPHQPGRQEHQRKSPGKRHQGDTRQREAHSDRQRIRRWPGVGIEPDKRLQNRSRQLKSQGNQSHLAKGEFEAFLQQRVDRGDYRLNRIVEKVRKTDRQKNRYYRSRPNSRCATTCVHFSLALRLSKIPQVV